jgi:hypothetical protein
LSDRQCLIERNGTACDPLRKILALDEFHRQRAHVFAVFEAVNLRDVRMVERRERLRPCPIPPSPIWAVMTWTPRRVPGLRANGCVIMRAGAGSPLTHN